MTPLTTLDPGYLVILCMLHCIISAFTRSSPGFDHHWSPSVLDILPLQVTPRSGCPNEHALVTTFNSDPGMCPWLHLTLLCVTDIVFKSLLPRRLSTISHGFSSVCSRIRHFETWCCYYRCSEVMVWPHLCSQLCTADPIASHMADFDFSPIRGSGIYEYYTGSWLLFRGYYW